MEGSGSNGSQQGMQGVSNDTQQTNFQNYENGVLVTVQNNKGGIGPVQQQEEKKGIIETIKSKMPSMPTSIWPFGKKDEKSEYNSFKGDDFESFKTHMNKEQYVAPSLDNGTSSTFQTTYKPDPSWNPQQKTVVPEKKIQGISQWENDSKKSEYEDGSSVESQIVEEITGNSGVRTMPTRQQLSEFCSRCLGVNSELIASILDEKLESPHWQVKNKSLCCIEALIKAKNEKITKYFTENSENISKETQSQIEAVSSKSVKIMRLLNKEVEITSSKVETHKEVKEVKRKEEPIKTQKQTSSTNLIDIDPFGDVKKEEKEEDLFEGLTLNETKPEIKESPKINQQVDKKMNILDSFFGSESTYVAPPKINSPKGTNVVYTSGSNPYPQNNSPQIIYVVQQQKPLNGPIINQRNLNNMPPRQQQQSFEFLNNNTKSNESSHFDFIKEEMAKTKN